LRDESISVEGIRKLMHRPGLSFEIHESIGSTNDRAAALAREAASAGTVVIAGTQTAGKGRQGRQFFSPEGTGVYMSLLLHPESLEHPEKITVTAAVAAAKTIEAISGRPTKIKWVNDVFMDGKKVCGILTEGGQMADGSFWAVLGIGVNLLQPETDFPPELQSIAGAVLENGDNGLRERFIAGVLDEFLNLYENAPEDELYEAYCSRDMFLSTEVYITENGREYPATAAGISRDFSLRVRMADGSIRDIHSGEARARQK